MEFQIWSFPISVLAYPSSVRINILDSVQSRSESKNKAPNMVSSTKSIQFLNSTIYLQMLGLWKCHFRNKKCCYVDNRNNNSVNLMSHLLKSITILGLSINCNGAKWRINKVDRKHKWIQTKCRKIRNTPRNIFPNKE